MKPTVNKCLIAIQEINSVSHVRSCRRFHALHLIINVELSLNDDKLRISIDINTFEFCSKSITTSTNRTKLIETLTELEALYSQALGLISKFKFFCFSGEIVADAT